MIRTRTPPMPGQRKTVLFDLQGWVERRMPGEPAEGYGILVYREDCRTPEEMEKSVDQALSKLKFTLLGSSL